MSPKHRRKDENRWKLCAPRYDRARVLHENHDGPTASHMDIRITATYISRLYYWPGMFQQRTRNVRGYQSFQVHLKKKKLCIFYLLPLNDKRKIITFFCTTYCCVCIAERAPPKINKTKKGKKDKTKHAYEYASIALRLAFTLY